MSMLNRLSTIHFYIILKPILTDLGEVESLSTIHFYIILKQAVMDSEQRAV